MAPHATCEQRLADEDHELDNDGDVGELAAQVSELWEQLTGATETGDRRT
jgi:hypothetical protein